MSMIDLSSKIERLEAFEERLSVRIENASAWFSDGSNYLHVLFELHPQTGTSLSNDIDVIIAVYNSKGQLVAKDRHLYLAKRFWGFEATKCLIGQININEITKIRIYPTLQ